MNILFYIILTQFQQDKKNPDLNKYAVQSNLGEVGVIYTPSKYKMCDTIWLNKTK